MPLIAPSENPPSKPRARGRPPQTESERIRLRDQIISATAAAYAETGYHGLTVQSILDKAHLSRPTFYRYFSNVDEPVCVVIELAHRDLVDRLKNKIPPSADMETMMKHAVSLYLDWGKSVGPLLRPLYVELHDPMSPVSRLRPQVLQRIGELYAKSLQAHGLTMQSPLLIDLMITGIEFLGYRYHLERSSGRVTLDMLKDAGLRLMICTIAKQEDLLAQIRKRRARRKSV
jgi:TetR/AcrR family transcriptional regulator